MRFSWLLVSLVISDCVLYFECSETTLANSVFCVSRCSVHLHTQAFPGTLSWAVFEFTFKFSRPLQYYPGLPTCAPRASKKAACRLFPEPLCAILAGFMHGLLGGEPRT